MDTRQAIMDTRKVILALTILVGLLGVGSLLSIAHHRDLARDVAALRDRVDHLERELRTFRD